MNLTVHDTNRCFDLPQVHKNRNEPTIETCGVLGSMEKHKKNIQNMWKSTYVDSLSIYGARNVRSRGLLMGKHSASSKTHDFDGLNSTRRQTVCRCWVFSVSINKLSRVLSFIVEGRPTHSVEVLLIMH